MTRLQAAPPERPAAPFTVNVCLTILRDGKAIRNLCLFTRTIFLQSQLKKWGWKRHPQFVLVHKRLTGVSPQAAARPAAT